MKIEVTSPTDKPLNFDKEVEKTIELFEDRLRDKPDGLDEYYLSIEKTNAKVVNDEIIRLYQLAAWGKVEIFCPTPRNIALTLKR